MPEILRGTWFSWEVGRPTQTVIDATTMSGRGLCIAYEHKGADYTFMFKGKTNCYHCVHAFPRTWNVFEKFEGPCVTLEPGKEPTIKIICEGIKTDQQLITLFKENYAPINCRSSLEGVWQFAYQVLLTPSNYLLYVFKMFTNLF